MPAFYGQLNAQLGWLFLGFSVLIFRTFSPMVSLGTLILLFCCILNFTVESTRTIVYLPVAIASPLTATRARAMEAAAANEAKRVLQVRDELLEAAVLREEDTVLLRRRRAGGALWRG